MHPKARVIPVFGYVRSAEFAQMEHREQQGTWISTGCSKTNLRVALLVCRLMLQQAACSVSAQGTVSGAICPPLQPVTRTEALLQQPLAAEAAPRRPALPDVLPKLLWPCCLRPQERLGEGAGLGACGPCMCAEMVLVSPSSQGWRKHSLELQERLPGACAPSRLEGVLLGLMAVVLEVILV